MIDEIPARPAASAVATQDRAPQEATERRPAPAAPELLSRHSDRIARRLRASRPPPASMSGLMAAYHMGWVDRDGRPDTGHLGKLVRPGLCLWGCEAAGSDPAAALPAACAVEWVHNFTLVHDDIQDGDRERRHRATVWSIWGASQGINAGDALHAIAFEVLLAPGPLALRRMRAAHALATAIREVVEGQCRDLAMEGRLRASPTGYLAMARRKTGALLGASLEMGAIVGGAPRSTAAAMRRAGILLGLAFQLRDDWLGIWGERELTGKSRDGDLARRKITHPVVAGYAAMPRTERRRFHDVFAGGGEAAVPELRAMLERRRAADTTEGAARRFADEAAALVRGSGVPDARAAEFEDLARYVVERQA